MSMKEVEKILFEDNFFSKVVAFILIATGIFLIVTVSANTTMRYILRSDFPVLEEINTLVAFWLYSAGAVYAAKRRGLISAKAINIFVSKPQILYAIEMFQRFFTLFLCVAFALWGWKFFWWSFNGGGRSNILHIPLVVGHCSVFLSFLAMLAYFIRDLIMLLKVKPSKYQPGSA